MIVRYLAWETTEQWGSVTGVLELLKNSPKPLRTYYFHENFVIYWCNKNVHVCCVVDLMCKSFVFRLLVYHTGMALDLKMWEGGGRVEICGFGPPSGWDRVRWAAKFWVGVRPSCPPPPASAIPVIGHLILTISPWFVFHWNTPDSTRTTYFL